MKNIFREEYVMLSKSDKNYLLNIALAGVTTVCIFTGVFYDNRLRFAHEMSGYLMSILVLAHLVLHAQWIKATTKNILSDKRKLTALLLTIVISVGVCALLLFKAPNDHRGGDNFRRQFGHSQGVNG